MSKPILGYEPGPEADDADTTYRYVVDGEVIREFKDEPTALIYFDEDRENCIKLATEHKVNMKRSILDDTGYRTVTLISDICKPEVYERPKFERTDRPKLEGVARQALSALKSGDDYDRQVAILRLEEALKEHA